MAAKLVFMVPFKANLTRSLREALGRSLALRVKRTDDWDDEVGFRHVGRTGSIRMYQIETDSLANDEQYYELHGTAVDSESQRLVKNELAACRNEVNVIGGQIDERRTVVNDTLETPARQLGWEQLGSDS